MNETQIMQELVFAYFKGRIEMVEEKRLFEFIQKDEQNYAQFKEWEKKWLVSNKADLQTGREWERIQCKIRTHEVVNSMVSKSKSGVWKRVDAIAAKFVLIASTLGGVESSFPVKPDQCVVFEAPFGEKRCDRVRRSWRMYTIQRAGKMRVIHYNL